MLDAKNPSWRSGPAETRVLEPPAGPYPFPAGAAALQRLQGVTAWRLPPPVRGAHKVKRRQGIGRESVLLASLGPIGPKAVRSDMMVTVRPPRGLGRGARALLFSVDNYTICPQK